MAKFGKDPLGAWVLKCNPATWDLNGFLEEGRSQLGGWVVHDNRRASAMAPGDRVVFWVSGVRPKCPPGVWAVGEVTGAVHRGRPGEHWLVPADNETVVDVDVVVEALLLSRIAIKSAPVLAASELIAMPQMSNPAMLTETEWEALQSILPRVGSPRGRELRNRPPIQLPARRLLRTYAFDPMSSRLSGRYLVVDVPFESSLRPGPVGELVEVVDYDATREEWLIPVDLDDPAILAQSGMRPAEHDPRTHQQVVYAVTMSVLERFERFAGRRFRWRASKRLRLVPHAFEGHNAYFDPRSRAVLFGYYRADLRDPGANLPGQWVFTCLSTDIIAHEVTHAIVHRLRSYYSEATNRDVFAWHEAFADLVALFQHFVFPEVVREAITSTSADLREGGALFELAHQFGSSTGRGAALRKALDADRSPEAFRTSTEPHERGAFLVAAVFDAYLEIYQRGVADLIRIATGGSGVLPPGRLPVDLVNRVASEAARLADTMLGVIVRAFDYLPVVDVTFGDVVRAIVTADHILFPDDVANLRGTLVECLRKRGIYPEGVTSLADDALMWPRPDQPLTLMDPNAPVDLSELILSATFDLDTAGQSAWALGAAPKVRQGDRLYQMVTGWARSHALQLGLDPDDRVPIGLAGIHVAYRLAQDGQPRPEIVVQLAQRRDDLEDVSLPRDARAAYRAGATVIARIDGQVDFVVVKPLPFTKATQATLPPGIAQVHHRAGLARRDALDEWFGRLERDDAVSPWTMQAAAKRVDFASLHAQYPEQAAR